MTDDLLPPNATDLERALAALSKKLEIIPVPLPTLYQPLQCPVALLPWLAWAFSVDTWEDSWDEQSKRELIAHSLIIHQKKGTRAALTKALVLLGVSATLIEWWQHSPRQRAHTFTLAVDTVATRIQRPLNPNLYQQIDVVIEQTKPARSHYRCQMKATLQSNLCIGLQLRLQQFSRTALQLTRQWSEIKTPIQMAVRITPMLRVL